MYSKVLLKSPMADPNTINNKIIQLVGECLNEEDIYVNLDTVRKNKKSTMNSKKNIFICHRFRIFSISRETLDSTSENLQRHYPNMTPASANSLNLTYETIANAFDTINRLMITPLMEDKTRKSQNPQRPRVENLFKDSTTSLIQAMASMNLNEDSSQKLKTTHPKNVHPKTAHPKPAHPKRRMTRPKSLPAPKPKSSTVQQKPKSSQPKRYQPKQSQPKPTIRQKPKPSQQKPKSSQQKPKSSQQSIPALTRNKVWREWCGNVMDGKCFCCEETIGYEKWHCGHVVARERGGSVEPDNLRPTCSDCNLGMGTLHMYEWILMNRLPGYRHLDPKDPIVRHNFEIVQAAAKTGERIQWLEQNGYITKTAANTYRRKIVSKRSDTRSRIQVMEEITDLYRKIHG